MTPERWQQVERLLDAALEREPPEWPALLEAACAGDPELRCEVESLLARAAPAAHFLESPAAALLTTAAAEVGAREHRASPEGRRVGAYRLVGEIARGGMGRVFLAERADGQFEQQVALKLLHPGIESEDAERRLRVERQILAALEHPGIARLLDGGVTEDGQPFLVMEYVEGVPLDRYSDTHALDLEQRLRLFLRVCEAVRYAHRQLVVHRDLKPANILVVEPAAGDAGEGQIKLLDFGIAKLLDDAALPLTLPLTQAGQYWLTPDYAAPEQLRGEPISTATDVYQLGVVLYELLTSRRPYRLAGRSPAEAERVVCQQEPARPSTVVLGRNGNDLSPHGGAEAVASARRTTPERLRRQLSGDLDGIVLAALQKEPERRYASVAALIEDVERYLTGRPVHARGDSRGYRARKFVRRHRWGVASSAALVLLLLGFVAAMAVQAERTARQRDRAEEATAFLASLFKEFEPVAMPGTTVTTREILDRGVRRIRAELQSQPLLQAELLDMIGRIYQYRGFFGEAEAILEEALAIRLRVLGPDHLEVADSRHHLAILHYGSDNQADYLADTLFAAVVATYRRELGSRDPRVAGVLTSWGLALRERGEYAAAESLFREVVAPRRDEPEFPPGVTAQARMYLAKLLTRRGAYAEAEAQLAEALTARRATFGNEHPVVANTLDALGELQLARNEHALAEHTFQQALEMRRRFFEEDHPDIVTSQFNLGEVRHALGDNEEAERLLRAGLENLQGVLAESALVARVLQRLAAIRLARGDPVGAESMLQQALEIWDRQPRGRSHPEVEGLLLELSKLRAAPAGR